MALNIDTHGVRRTGEHVKTAGAVLAAPAALTVPACGSDDVSGAVMANLNAWQDWLMQHVRAGAQQAAAAAAGIAGTATAYEAQDLAAAATYPGGHSAPEPPAAAEAPATAASPAPAGPPNLVPIPDISGQDGEQIALALEAGAGTAPAVAAASRLTGLAAQAQAAHTALMAAYTELLGAGESAANPPLLARLSRAIVWAQGVTGHAGALAVAFTSAAGLHTSARTAVGHSAQWQVVKKGYRQAVLEQQLTGPAGIPKVRAFKTRLASMQQSAGFAMTGYQSGGQTVSSPPAPLLGQPGLDPNGQDSPGPLPPEASTVEHKLDDKDPASPASSEGAGQNMLTPLMGALGPLLQSVGGANPLQALGQVGQQLGQLASAAKPASSAIKPAAVAHPNAGAGKGGGGGSIKPSGGLGATMHPASATGTPGTSRPTTPAAGAPAAAKGASASQAGGMGMMPMGAQAGDKSVKPVTSYEQPLPKVDDRGRPGVVGDTTKPAPKVKPEASNAVQQRLAARKKDAAAQA